MSERGERARLRLIDWLLLITAGLVFAAIALPSFLPRSRTLRYRRCQENLFKIDVAMAQRQRDKGFAPDATVSWEDLFGAPGGPDGYLKSIPVEPSGYSYVIGAIGESPYCTSGLPGHSLSEIGTAILQPEE